MSAFLIFDVHDSLVFSHCDPKFELFLVQCHDHELPASDGLEVVRNLLTLLVTPYVSVLRHQAHSALLLPHTLVAHCEWQQFVFVHLWLHEATAEPEHEFTILLQRKVSLFCQLVLFLFGNALHSIDKYELSLRILIKMLAKWESVSHEVPFMVESVERLFLGLHMEGVCKQVVARVEQLIRLHMARRAPEILTCFMVMYKDRQVYRHESAQSRCTSQDMLAVLLLSLSVQLFPPTAGDLSSEGSNFDESLTADKLAGSYFQHLVFLQCSYNYQIPVPHIYRKVMITQELYIVSLSEVSSILMISLPTLLHSITELKQNVRLQGLSSKKEIENLISCVRHLARYIDKNVRPILARQTFNLNALQQLNELAKKATGHQPTNLVAEQADRILALVLSDLYNCYQEVAFKGIYYETLPVHMQSFEAIISEASELLHETFSVCLDYIQVKNETNALALATACDLMHLVTFIFIDRDSGYFVLGNQDTELLMADRSEQMLANMIVHSYRSRGSSETEQLVAWSEGDYRFAYFCTDESGQTCALARILKKLEAFDERYEEAIRPSGAPVGYELFCVFKSSTLNEQISHNNMLDIAKLIKLYING